MPLTLMATINYWLDARREHSNGRYQLKVVVSNYGQKAYLPLPSKFCFSKEDWDVKIKQVRKTCPNFRALNAELNERMDEMQERLDIEFGPRPVQSAQFIARKLATIRGASEKSLTAVFEEYAELIKTPKSKQSYEYTLKTLRKYDPCADDLRFEDIDYKWLCTFRDTMYETISVNTTAIHLENLRAVFNYARKMEITEKYPFNNFRIERQKVKPPVMDKEDLERFLAFKPAYPSEDYYHDYWCLIFGLCGINMADLYVLRDEDLKAGRIRYNRQKTDVFASIKVEPEVMEIIKRRKGKNGMLLDLSEKWPSGLNGFLSRMNRAIKTWGPWHRKGRGIIIDETPWTWVTSYTARRQWATMAGELGIPTYIIDAGLAHAETSMTSHYITVRDKQLDEANRKVLDYVHFKNNKCPEMIVLEDCPQIKELRIS